MGNNHQPFHLKYRPLNFDELIGQDVISLTLTQALITNKIAPAYLFCGPRGTGKTSSARIFAKSLNCQKYSNPCKSPCNTCELCKSINIGIALDIIEIDAASNTGVENIREIIERANFAPTQARWKVYVIDECHMLSTAASNALLKTIEEPPERVVFILATTNPERVLKTIQSRCQKFNFKRINSEHIYNHLLGISNKEAINFEDEGLRLIAKRSNGGMRDAQRLLDQLSLIPNGITKKNVEELLGEVSENDLLNLIDSLIKNVPDSLIQSCSNLYDLGNEPIAILEGLLNITRDLLLKTVEGNYSDLFYTSKEFQPEIERISKLINKSKIIEWHRYLKNLEYQIKNSSQPRLWLEIHLTSLLKVEDQNTIKNQDTVHDQELRQDKNLISAKENLKTIIKNEKITVNDQNKEINKNIDDESINLKEKWSLILSKLELPSTRMLLSQQAELISIESNTLKIGLAPNWENMIKSRTVVIEGAVKKIFGEHMSISFTSKNNNKNLIINSDQKSEEGNDIQKKFINYDDSKNTLHKNNDSQFTDSKIINNDKLSENSISIEKNSSKNLADFFNGQIVETEQE